MVIPYSKNLKEISKTLRRQPTQAERCLWNRLKLKHLGYIFHRQKPIGGYIVDFYCPQARLIIEVDGDYHRAEQIKQDDKLRDETMKSLGLQVLRFKNSEILNNIDDVIDKVAKTLVESAPKE